jgi:outer membrane lipase/esterase
MLAYNGASDVSGGLITTQRRLDLEGRWGVYADFNIVLGRYASSADLSGYSFVIPGFTVGADYRLRDDLLLGLASGYRYTTASFKGAGGNTTANTWPLTAYAAYFPGQAYVFGSLGYTLNLYDLDRRINFSGLNRTAKGSTTGHQFNLYAEAGYDFKPKSLVITLICRWTASKKSGPVP